MTVLSERIADVREALQANAQRLAAARSRLTEIRQELHAGRARRQELHEVAFAQLLAQLETMPAVEQAKGILMAQSGCGPQEAFDMLRRAAQRCNVGVDELAADVVARTARRQLPLSRPAEPSPPPGHAAWCP